MKKIVFVSGAGGSIGSEICREIIFHEPSLIFSLITVNLIYTQLKVNYQK